MCRLLSVQQDKQPPPPLVQPEIWLYFCQNCFVKRGARKSKFPHISSGTFEAPQLFYIYQSLIVFFCLEKNILTFLEDDKHFPSVNFWSNFPSKYVVLNLQTSKKLKMLIKKQVTHCTNYSHLRKPCQLLSENKTCYFVLLQPTIIVYTKFRYREFK